ncbi:protein LATE ELONGATED HYPOCOTYL isoform X2 [Diospyros lotus]|uniref:protein LATE ELONGATED HYPOCOTYL isoform X2 n=1 Tax=Diospyros lotus TaxID=55363 RepID=UPI002255A1E1|nr:protein LATE ELONGATED HYPOCOTYL isoform X2 [Diospyros lotus]
MGELGNELKLEKEALVKGVPIRQTFDIEIPPPRPKKKPSNPYPRKTGGGSLTPHVGAAKDGKKLSPSSLSAGKQILDLERLPLSQKCGGDVNPVNAKENQDDGNYSEILSLSQEAQDSVPTPGTFREFVPMMVSTQDETKESYDTVEPNGAHNASNFKSSNFSHQKFFQGMKTDEMSNPENVGPLLSSDLQATQSYPRHVPVHVLNGNLGMSTHNVSPDLAYQESKFHQIGETHGLPNLCNPSASAITEHQISASRSSVYQSFPPFHPLFGHICNNEDEYRSYLHLSSSFSSLIVTTLLQNPAVHAAASFAASFWPCTNMEASADSPVGTLGGFPSKPMNAAPSTAAIAAATVAAATAWWAAHGMLPMCSAFQPAFSCTPSATTIPVDASVAAGNNDKRERAPHDLSLQNQQLDPEYSEALDEQHSALKLPSMSSSEYEESEGAKPNATVAVADHEESATVTGLHDSNKMNSRKQVDRSSCGSNTPSSSEVETDALEKSGKDNEESKEPDVSHTTGDCNNRRSRSISCTDSWKEVSEEGRLAFMALFSRERLPQSFSPPHDLKNKEYQKKNGEKDKQKTDEKAEDASLLDLNSKAAVTTCSHEAVENKVVLRGEECMLRMEIGLGKLKARRTGFKPYKRCSVEAKEGKMAIVSNQGEEKASKRIRLEGEASS